MPRSRPAQQRAVRPATRALEPLEPRTLLSVQLVSDLNPAPGSSDPSNAVQMNGVTLFAAGNNTFRGLWRTDGTPDGTTLLGAGSTLLGVAGNSAFYAPDSGGIVQTDGTTLSSVYNSTIGSPRPETSAALGKTLYFTSGNRLFKISAGYVLEVNLSANYANFTRVLSTGSKLILLDQSSLRLWASDGTSAGTRLLSVTLDSGYPPTDLVGMDGAVYFTRHTTSGYELWKTQGTDATTVALATGLIARPTSLTVAGHTLFFWGGSPGYGQVQLWKSDGTAAGTTLVGNVALPGYYGGFSGPPALVASGSKVFFSYNDYDPADAYEASKLWVSDGTAAGTKEVRHDVGVATPPYQGVTMFDYNGTLLFQGYDAAAAGGQWSLDFELWKSDGTATGTTLVSDIVPGAGGSQPLFVGLVGSQALFSAADPQHGREPWVTDGTAQGTHPLKEINAGTADSSFQTTFSVNGKLVFSANQGMFVVDAPGEAPHRLTFADGSQPSGSIGAAVTIGTQAYFLFTPNSGGDYAPKLCVTDGTSQGTRIVKTLPSINSISNFTAVGSRLFFTGGNYGSASVYTSDGTEAGTVALAGGFAFSSTSGTTPNLGFAAVGNQLYFGAQIGSGGAKELWTSDGTPQGTVRLISFPASGSSVWYLTPANGRLYFTGGDRKLYQTDGTATGTAVVGTGAYDPRGTAPDGSLLLADGSTGKLLRLGPTDAAPTPLANVVPDNAPTARAGNWLYFLSGSQIWRTDGTPQGTTVVAANLLADPANLTAVGDRVYYIDTRYGTGAELWATDGTLNGEYLVADMIPGWMSPGVANLTAVNDTLYFTALDGVHGRELFRASGADDVAPAATYTSFSFGALLALAQVQFTENVGSTLALGDWKLIDRNTGQDVSQYLTAFTYDDGTDVATLKITRDLPNGDYRLILPAGAAADQAGNPTAADITLDFFQLIGDLNRDRVVNFDDLLILAKHYNQPDAGYTGGDINGDRVVNFDDLLLLAKNYGVTLTLPPAIPAPTVAAPANTAALTPTARPKPKPKPVFSVTPTSPKHPPAPPKRQATVRKNR